MNILRRIAVFGLWGEQNLAFDVHRDINFLIGENGTGKTTVINLIAAILTADIPTLSRLSFSNASLELVDPETDSPSTIAVSKEQDDISAPLVEYAITAGRSESVKYRLPQTTNTRFLSSLGTRNPTFLTHRLSLTDHLTRLLNVRWLSVNRAEATQAREDRSGDPDVDRKLDQLGTELTKLFSALTKLSEAETIAFQRVVFASLLHQESFSSILDNIKEIDIERERSILHQIFSTFKIPASDGYSAKIDYHFEMLRRALDQVARSEGVEANEIGAIIAVPRLQIVIKEWNAMVTRQEQIQRPTTLFLKILNDLFRRKTARVNDRNELVLSSDSGRQLNLKDLSSGEKQLIIILGEALLQGNARCIYIADEPEISLHVAWQEHLVTNLRRLNSNSQLLFATHSPDIVSSYDDRVLQMEAIIG